VHQIVTPVFFWIIGEIGDVPISTWLSGIIEESYEERGTNSVLALNDFNRFCTDMLKKGPVREEDIRSINNMIFIQWKLRRGLNYYSQGTGINWEWDGRPMVHIVVTGFCSNAANQLANDSLQGHCLTLQTLALERYAEDRTPEGQPQPWADLALQRAAFLKQKIDVPAILAEIKASVESRSTRYR